jgi:hypothetical protein
MCTCIGLPFYTCRTDSVRVQAEPLSGGDVTFCGNNDDIRTVPEFSDIYNNG